MSVSRVYVHVCVCEGVMLSVAARACENVCVYVKSKDVCL